jgi:hypothetical protein
MQHNIILILVLFFVSQGNIGLIHQVQGYAFTIEECEDRNKHLTMFETLCNTFRQKGLSLDFIRLKIFRCSLKEKYLAWLQSLLHCL